MGLIYKITNLVNGHFYIGMTARFLWERWDQHQSDARNGSKLPIHCAIRKYGKENFSLEMLQMASPEELPALEMREIFAYGANKRPNYNCTVGGDGVGYGENHPMFGKNHSPESRAQMSASHAGKTKTEEHKRKIRESNQRIWSNPEKLAERAGKGNSFYGRQHSAETKEKIRKASGSRTHSAEVKQRIAATLKARWAAGEGWETRRANIRKAA